MKYLPCVVDSKHMLLFAIEYSKELNVLTKKAKKNADNESAVLEKIAAWREPYISIGERLHEIITKTVPDLKPRLWYGMPGYAKDGPRPSAFSARIII